jgi:uncharacterized iron-regulated protein
MKKPLPILFILMTVLSFMAFRSDKPAYRIFTTKGKSASYEELIKAAKGADVVFFGEEHSNPICHWLELELMKDLYESRKEKFAVGMEMLETDNQLLLNEYLNKMIRKKDFEAEAKLWKNYPTDYAPIVDFARENGIKLYATNIPRRFAALVNLKGFEGLDSINAVERGMMAHPRIKYNPELGCYKNMLANMGDAAAMHDMTNLPKAQAMKDATMAWFIFKNLSIEGMTFLHINGAYHSDNHEGIVWYLKEYNKRTANTLNIVTISTVEQASINKLDTANVGKADFILCIPESMPKSHESFLSAPMPPPSSKPALPPVKIEKQKHDSVSTSPSDDDEEDDDD